MKLDRLTKALTMTLQIIISLVLFIIVLPFFVLWRVSISFLYLAKKEKEEPKNADQEREKQEAKEGEKGKDDEEEEEEESKPPPPPPPPPPKDAHERALTHYNPVWESFRDLAINKPLVTHWSRIADTIVLLTQTMLSLALLEKSLVYHIPWFVTHLSNTHYKTSKEKVWWNDLLLHMSGLVITCAPFVGLIGVGVGILYYSRKVWKYGRFKKGAAKRTGGEGMTIRRRRKGMRVRGNMGLKRRLGGLWDMLCIHIYHMCINIHNRMLNMSRDMDSWNVHRMAIRDTVETFCLSNQEAGRMGTMMLFSHRRRLRSSLRSVRLGMIRILIRWLVSRQSGLVRRRRPRLGTMEEIRGGRILRMTLRWRIGQGSSKEHNCLWYHWK